MFSNSAGIVFFPFGLAATGELDLIATEMLAFPPKSSINKNDSDLDRDPRNGKTTPI